MRICSWNVQWGRGRDGRVDLVRSAAVLKACHADVACLQEVAVNQPGLPGGPVGDQAAQLAAIFSGFEAIWGAGSDMPDGCGGRSRFGELVLSRLPVLEVFRHRLPWPADPSVPSMQRVAVEAVVATAAGSLRIVTTHLEFYSRDQRVSQVEALRELYVEGWQHARRPRSSADTDPPFAVLPRGELAVICGDFNFGPETPEHARMEEAFAGETARAPRLLDAWTLLHPGVPHPPTTGFLPTEGIPAPTCFDFFFVSENLASKLSGMAVDLLTEASDHQPVMIDLAL